MPQIIYDLTTAQSLLLLMQTFTLHKQVNNICTSVLIDQPLDLDILREAVRIAYARNDSLHIRLIKDHGTVKQYFTEDGPPEIETLDFRGQDPVVMERALSRLALKRITFFNRSLSKVYILLAPGGPRGLFLKVSHLILDSYGIIVFYKDILKIYKSLVDNAPLPAPLNSYERVLQKDLAYKDTAAYLRDKAHWEKEIFTSEPIYSHLSGSGILDRFRKQNKNDQLRYVRFVPLFTRAKNEMLWFPKEIMDQAIVYSKAQHVSLSAIFLLAYRSFLSKVNRREPDITINLLISRRSTREKKNTGGSMVQVFPFRSILSENSTFQAALVKIGTQLRSLYRHTNMDTVEIIRMPQTYFKTGSSGGYISSVFTFQPIPLVTEDGTPVQSRWYGNGTSGTPFYLTIMDGDNSGGLKCYYEYHTHSIKSETIRKFHAYMVQMIQAGTQNDQLSLGQLLDLN